MNDILIVAILMVMGLLIVYLSSSARYSLLVTIAFWIGIILFVAGVVLFLVPIIVCRGSTAGCFGKPGLSYRDDYETNLNAVLFVLAFFAGNASVLPARLCGHEKPPKKERPLRGRSLRQAAGHGAGPAGSVRHDCRRHERQQRIVEGGRSGAEPVPHRSAQGHRSGCETVGHALYGPGRRYTVQGVHGAGGCGLGWQCVCHHRHADPAPAPPIR